MGVKIIYRQHCSIFTSRNFLSLFDHSRQPYKASLIFCEHQSIRYHRLNSNSIYPIQLIHAASYSPVFELFSYQQCLILFYFIIQIPTYLPTHILSYVTTFYQIYQHSFVAPRKQIHLTLFFKINIIKRSHRRRFLFFLISIFHFIRSYCLVVSDRAWVEGWRGHPRRITNLSGRQVLGPVSAQQTRLFRSNFFIKTSMPRYVMRHNVMRCDVEWRQELYFRGTIIQWLSYRIPQTNSSSAMSCHATTCHVRCESVEEYGWWKLGVSARMRFSSIDSSQFCSLKLL